MTSKVVYIGQLSTEATHIKSGQTIITDAPTDNQGKGEAFSPTDLMSTSLASCMLTIMGIAARTHEINMDGAQADVLKIMADNPRRVSGINITIKMPEYHYDHKSKQILIHAAENCPVMKSLHPEIVVNLDFLWHG